MLNNCGHLLWVGQTEYFNSPFILILINKYALHFSSYVHIYMTAYSNIITVENGDNNSKEMSAYVAM